MFRQAVLLLASLSLTNAVAVAHMADCEPSGSECPSTDCCGTASYTNKSDLKLCFTAGTSTWNNADDNNLQYTVSNCPVKTVADNSGDASAEPTGSMALTASASFVVLSATYLMA